MRAQSLPFSQAVLTFGCQEALMISIHTNLIGYLSWASGWAHISGWIVGKNHKFSGLPLPLLENFVTQLARPVKLLQGNLQLETSSVPVCKFGRTDTYIRTSPHPHKSIALPRPKPHIEVAVFLHQVGVKNSCGIPSMVLYFIILVTFLDSA